MKLLAALYGFALDYNAILRKQARPGGFSGWSDIYDLCEAYYLNNDLYAALRDAFHQQATVEPSSTVGLRNPAFRLVEFYAAKVFPWDHDDGLPVRAERDQILGPIEQIWEWSNWIERQSLAGRFDAMYGDLYLQAATKGDTPRTSQAYFTVLNPRFVTETSTDFRGYLTRIRLDVPQAASEASGQEGAYYVTDIWDKATDSFRRWTHRQGSHAALDALGAPAFERSMRVAYHIDFVPFTHAPFRNIGIERGLSAILTILEKADHANQIATALHQRMFRWNRAFFVSMANLEGAAALGLDDDEPAAATEIDLSTGEKMINLAGKRTITPLVPNLAWADHLAVVDAMMDELEYDSPELAYSKLRQLGETSGRAVALLLSDTTDRTKDVRRSAWRSLARIDMMCLHLGRERRIPSFGAIGTFAGGDYRHRFVDVPVIPISDYEEAQTQQTRAQAAAAIEKLRNLRLLVDVLRFTEQQAEAILAAAAATGQTVLDTLAGALPPAPAPTEDAAAPDLAPEDAAALNTQIAEALSAAV